jgi:hypothetical protein
VRAEGRAVPIYENLMTADFTIGLDTFLDYASRGLPVFPVWGIRNGRCECGNACGRDAGKHPVGWLAPDGVSSATLNNDTIRRWVAEAGARGWSLNVGVAVPPGLAVVDIDPRNGGTATIQQLEAQHGPLPQTAMVATGGGGWHLWLQLPDATFRLPSKLGKGVDIRQAGGYVVAPPSLHESGKRYSWITQPTHRFAAAPQWVEQRGYRPSAEESDAETQITEGTYAPASLPPEAHRALAEQLAPHWQLGQKHTLAKALGGWLRQRGWTTGDVVETLRLLPSDNPVKRIAAALACHTAGKLNGWEELRLIVGPDAAARLDSGTRNTIREQLDASRAADSDFWTANVAPFLTVRRTDVAPLAALPEASPDDPLCGLPLIQPDEQLRPLERIVEGLDLVAGYTTGLVGRPYAAKTPIAIVLALCVANGVPFAGRQTKPSPVYYLTAEKPYAADRKRVRAARAMNVAAASVSLVNMTQLPINSAPVRERLARVAQRRPGALFILDTYGASVQGVEHNSADYSQPLKDLSNALTAAGAAVLVVMHAKKGTDAPALGDLEGHTSVIGALDAAIATHRNDPDDPNTLELRCIRAIDREFPAFLAAFSDPPIEGLAEPGLLLSAVSREGESIANADESFGLTQRQQRDRQAEGKLLAILVGQQGGVSYDVLRQAVPDARKYLRELCKAGRVFLAKQGVEEYYVLQEKPKHESVN